MADNETTANNTQDLNQLLGQSPFGRLLNIQGADGNNLTARDIFGNLGSGGGNAFGGGASAGGAGFSQNSPYGGNPFAGDNFWNIFAGGVNPSNPTANTSSGGGAPSGGNPFAGGGGAPSGGGNPFAGGGGAPSGGGNPFAGGGGAPSGGNPFAGGGGAPSGGNPFAGGGGAPSGGNPFAGGGGAPSGGNPFAGGGGAPSGGNPFAGGGAPSGSPSAAGGNTQDLNQLLSQSPFAPLLNIEKADGSKLTVNDIFGNVNLPASSSPLGNGGDPFAGDNFWNTFGGGVNPATFSNSNIPAFAGGDIPQMPTGGATPVPEPSSVLGIAAIGLGIAATKFRQHQKRTTKAFNK